jgi:hypothetical protein
MGANDRAAAIVPDAGRILVGTGAVNLDVSQPPEA